MEDQPSKNFTMKELSCPCCNVMGCKPAAIEQLQFFRDLYGPLPLISAYRCPKHNAEVGGEPDSRHMEGLAFDIVCPKEGRYRMIEIAMSCGFHGIGLGENMIHIDYRLSNKSMWLYTPKNQSAKIF